MTPVRKVRCVERSHGSRRRAALLAAATLLVVAAAALFGLGAPGEPAEAQTVGVSAELLTNHKDSANAQGGAPNDKMAAGGTDDRRTATRFVTGSNPAGYRIESIAPWFFSASSGAVPVLEIWSNRGGTAAMGETGFQPAARLHTFRFAAGLGTGLRTFEAPGSGSTPGDPVVLKPNTAYWIVLSGTGTGWEVSTTNIQSSSRDTASQAGWKFEGRMTVRGTETFSGGIVVIGPSYNHPRFTIRGTPRASPSLTSAQITSSPLDGDTYYAGEHIEVVFTFDRPVKYVKGVASLYVGAGATNATYRSGEYMGPVGTNALLYRYRVTASDTDADGVAVGANPLGTTAQGSVVDATDNTVNAVVTHSGLAADTNHKVVGSETACQRYLCGDVSVASIATNVLGSIYYRGTALESVAGGISNRSFKIGSDKYIIDQLLVRDGDLELELNVAPPSGDLNLNVGGKVFRFSDAAPDENKLTWANSGLNWTAGAEVRFSIGISPLKLVSASVQENGVHLDLVFDNGLFHPPLTADQVTLYAALNNRFSITVDSSPVGFTTLIGNATTTGQGKLTILIRTTVQAGQTVVVTYTDETTGDDANVIQTLDGLDAESFTTGQGDTPPVVNMALAPVMVSNTGQTAGTALATTAARDTYAQSFRAGDHYDGYFLDAVDLGLSVQAGVEVEVSLWRAGRGNHAAYTFPVLHSGLVWFPREKLMTLSGPASIDADTTTRERFRAHDVLLYPNMTYWIVVSQTAGPAGGLSLATSSMAGAVDSGSAAASGLGRKLYNGVHTNLMWPTENAGDPNGPPAYAAALDRSLTISVRAAEATRPPGPYWTNRNLQPWAAPAETDANVTRYAASFSPGLDFDNTSDISSFALTSVILSVAAESPSTLRVRIHADSNGRPGTALTNGTLTAPAQISATLSAPSRAEFTTNTPIALSVDTTYWVVIDDSAGTGKLSVGTTISSSLDSALVRGNFLAHPWPLRPSAMQSFNGSSWSADSEGRRLRVALGGTTNPYTSTSASPALSTEWPQPQVGIGLVPYLNTSESVRAHNQRWQWQRGDASDGTFTDIPAADGGNGEVYTPVSADLGKWLKVNLTYDSAFVEDLTASVVSLSPVLSQPAFSRSGVAVIDVLIASYATPTTQPITRAAMSFATGAAPAGYVLSEFRYELERETTADEYSWAVHADEAGLPAERPLHEPLEIEQSLIDYSEHTAEQLVHPGLWLAPNTRYWVVLTGRGTSQETRGFMHFGAVKEEFDAPYVFFDSTAPLDSGSGTDWSVHVPPLAMSSQRSADWITWMTVSDLEGRSAPNFSVVTRDPVAVTANFSSGTYSVNEGSAVEVTVRLSEDAKRIVEIPITATSHGAVTADDYALTPSSVRFLPGETSGTVWLTALGDSADDNGEQVALSFGSLPGGVTRGVNRSATVTITNTSASDTTAPTLSSATVNAAGTRLELIFSEPFPVPADAVERQVFYEGLATRFSLSVGSIDNPVSVKTSESRTADKKLVLRPARRIGTGKTVTLSYSDPTTGNDANVIEDPSGNEMAGFTTGTGSVAAVTNGSTHDAGPLLSSATLNADGDEIELILDEAFAVPTDAADLATFYEELGDRFTVRPHSFLPGVAVSESGNPPVGATVDATQSSPTDGKIVLDTSSTIKQGRIVLVSYDDPTEGDDDHVIEDSSGNESATFTSGGRGLAEVTNNSTQGSDTTPPYPLTATVLGTGTAVELILSEAFAEPSTGVPAFYTALASRFALAVDGAAVSVTVSQTASDASAGKMSLTPASTIGQGARVELKYTDLTTSNDAANVVQDAAGNDMGTFFPDMQVINHAARGASDPPPTDTTPPTLISASVVASGNSVTLDFNEALQAPSGSDRAAFLTALASRLAVTADGATVDFSIPTRSRFDLAMVVLEFTNPVQMGQTIVVTYTDPAGDDAANVIQDAAGNDVATFTTGQGTVPAVRNNSTFVADTTPPTLSSATVSTAGTRITLIFSEPFAVPTSYVTLAGRFGLTVGGTAAGFSVNESASNATTGRLVLTPSATINNGQAVVVEYTDPSGVTANVIKDASGNKTVTFTTGQGTAPAVQNNSTQGTDTTAPSLSSATVNAAGDRIDLIFSESFAVPSNSSAFYTALASRLSLSVNSSNATFSINTTASDPSVRRLVLTPTSTILQNQTVAITYTDLTSGDDTANVLQDAAGNDVATFTTGSGTVPAVTNNSTAVASPPRLRGAQVGADGRDIQLLFTEPFVVPTGVGQPAAFLSALAGRFSLSVDGANKTFEVVSASMAIGETGTTLLNLRVGSGPERIAEGQTVVLIYTDPAGDNDNVIEDADGNETATFTTGQGGVPAVINRSEVDRTPPTLTGATVDSTGNVVTLDFSEQVLPPPASGTSDYEALVAALTITSNGVDVSITGLSGNSADNSQILVSVSPVIRLGHVVSVSYTRGTLTSASAFADVATNLAADFTRTAVNNSTVAVGTPSAPRNLTASANPPEINLAWDPPLENNGSAITGYRVERSPDGTSSWTVVVANTNSTLTSYSDTTAPLGATSHYRVAAVNSAGAGETSNSASARLPSNEDLTVRFESIPNSHDGSAQFEVVFQFSEEIDISAADFRAAVSVSHGTKGTVTVNSTMTEYTLPITPPSGEQDITITLTGMRACTLSGAICTAEDKQLDNSLTRIVRFAALPSSANRVVDVEFNTQYAFTPLDFPYTDEGGGPFSGIRVLPQKLAGRGELQLDGATLSENTDVTRQQLEDGELTYTPPGGLSGAAFGRFQFRVRDEAGLSSDPTFIVLRILPDPTRVLPAGVSLVSNVGQAHSRGSITEVLLNGERIAAQRFHTGDNQYGYTLSGIELRLNIDFRTASSADVSDVSVYPQIELRRGSPTGDVVATFQLPEVTPGGTNNYLYKPRAATYLVADTDYYVVASGGSHLANWTTTDLDTEDVATDPGWNIDNRSLSRPVTSMEFNRYTSPNANALMMRVNGVVNQTTPVGQDLQRPKLLTAVYDGSALTLTYNERLDETSRPATSDFFVVTATDVVPVSTVEVSGRIVTLTLSETIAVSAVVSLIYTPGDHPIQDPARNPAAPLSSQTVVGATSVRSVDTTPPLLQTAVVDGDVLTLTYDEALDSTSTPALSDFTVRVAGEQSTVLLVLVRGMTVELMLRTAALEGQAATVSYTPGANPVRNQVRLQAAALVSRAVTNSTIGPPRLESATVDGDTLTLTYNKPLDEMSTPTSSRFTVWVHRGNSARQRFPLVSDVDVSDRTVILTLASEVMRGEPVALIYNPGSTPIRDEQGNNAALLDRITVNNTTGLETDPPELRTVTVSEELLVLLYNERLGASRPATSDFSVTVNGVAATVSSVTVAGMIVTLELASPVTFGQQVRLSYTPGTRPIEDRSGNDAAAISNRSVTNNTADLTPILESADVNGVRLTLTYQRALDTNSRPEPTDFTVRVAGSVVSVQSVGISGQVVTLTLTERVSHGQSVTISYTPGATPIRSNRATQDEAAALSNRTLTNLTPDYTPLLESAVVDGHTLTLRFSRALQTSPLPAVGDFSARAAGSAVAVQHVRMAMTQVTLRLATAVESGQSVTLSYTPGANPIRSSEGDLAARLNNQPVTNVTDDATPPMLESTSARDTTLTLTYDEPLDDSSEPAATDFTVTVDRATPDEQTIAVTDVEISGRMITLTLAEAVASGQDVTISYTVGANPIRDLASPPNAAAALVDETVAIAAVVTTGGGGGGGGAPAPRVPSEADFDWNVTRDIDELAAEHGEPTGLWSDGVTVWILNNAASGETDRAFAYALSDGDRRAERDIEMERRNRFSHGLWSDGETLWVSDSGQDRLFAYELEGGERISTRDIELADDNANPRGIWSNGEQVYVLDTTRDSLFTYELDGGEFVAEHELPSFGDSPRGIWSDGTTFWVSDDGANRIFAFRLEAAGLRRVEAEEITFTSLLKGGNSDPRGIWSDGDVLWVADAEDDRVYSYNLPDALVTKLASLSLSDVEFGPFAPGRLRYNGTAAEGATSSTVSATPTVAEASVAITPLDADATADGHQVSLAEDVHVSVAVTSADESRARTYRVAVAVPEAMNQAPLASEIAPLDLTLGAEPRRQALSDWFTDPDDDELTYQLEPAVPAGVVRLQLSDGRLTLMPQQAGSARFDLRATDSRGASAVLTVQVRVAAEELVVATVDEVRITAQLAADGQIEFALQERSEGGSWSQRRLPRARFLPVDARVDIWLFSSPLSTTTESGPRELRIAANPRADGRVEFGLQERIPDQSWSDLRLPRARFLPADLEPGRWLVSTSLALGDEPGG